MGATVRIGQAGLLARVVLRGQEDQGVRKLPRCDPHAEASLALVADAQSTVLGETVLKTSRSHLIDQVMPIADGDARSSCGCGQTH